MMWNYWPDDTFSCVLFEMYKVSQHRQLKVLVDFIEIRKQSLWDHKTPFGTKPLTICSIWIKKSNKQYIIKYVLIFITKLTFYYAFTAVTS